MDLVHGAQSYDTDRPSKRSKKNSTYNDKTAFTEHTPFTIPILVLCASASAIILAHSVG